jgi:hypothetical protein
MTIADRACDGCGAFVAWRDAKIVEGRCLCPSCAEAPKEEIPMADNVRRCTEPGCTSPRFKKVSEKENLCYRHLKAKHPELLPPSMGSRTAAPPRKPVRIAATRRRLRSPAPSSNGAPRCEHCGQQIPAQVLKAAGILGQNGVKRQVAIKAAALILQAAS